MFERTDLDDVTVDELFVDVESKILGRGLRSNRIGGRRGGNAGGGNPLKRVLRRAVYDANSPDRDGDGLAQEGTDQEHPVTPKLEVPGSILSGNPLDDNSPARELVSLVKKPKNPLKRKKRSAKPDFDEILRVEEEDNRLAELRLEEEAKKLEEETKKIQEKLDRLNAKFRSGNEEWEASQDIELARESLETIAAALAEDEQIWDRSRLVVSPREAAMGRLQVMRDRLLLQHSHFDQLPDREFEELLYNLLTVDEPDWAVDYFKGLALQSAFERYGSRDVDEIVFSDDLDPDIPWQDVVSNPPISDSGKLDLNDIGDYIDSEYEDYDGLLLEQAIDDDPSNFYEFLQAYEQKESRDILAPDADLKTDEDLDTFWEARHREMYGHENAVAALSSPEGIALVESLQSLFESRFGPDSPIGQLFEKYDNPTPVVVLASHAGSHWAGGVAGQYGEGVITVGAVSDFESKTGAYILISEHKEIKRVIGDWLVKGGPDDHVATVAHEMGHAFHEVLNNNVTPMVSLTDLSREWDELADTYFSEMEKILGEWDFYQSENAEELDALQEEWVWDESYSEKSWLNLKQMRLEVERKREAGFLDEEAEATAERLIEAVRQMNVPVNQQISQYSLTNKLEAFAETFTAVMLDADTEGLSDSGQALVDFMRRVVDRPRVAEVSSFSGDKVSEPGDGGLVSERILERFSPREGFSGVPPALSVIEQPEAVSKEVSDLVKAIQDLEGKDDTEMHKLLVNYDDATVAAAARIIFDTDIDATGVSMLVGKSKIFDIPDADNNPTAVLPDTIFDEILKVDSLYSVPKSVFEDQEADFHNGSAGLHEIFQVLKTLDPGIDEDDLEAFDPSDASTWGDLVAGPMSDSQHRETLSAVLDFVVPNFEASSSASVEKIVRQVKVEEIVRKWEQDNPIPEFVRNFDAQVAKNPDWESQIPDRSMPDDGPLAGDKEALELSDALYALYDEQQSLLKAIREADRDFDMQKVQELSAQLASVNDELGSVNDESDELSKKLGDLLRNVRKRRDQLEADHAAERQVAIDEAESYVSSLPSEDFSREDIKEAFISSVLYPPDRPKNDDGSYKPVVLSEIGSAFSKQISALSSAETLLTMIESDPSVGDALSRIFDIESPYEFIQSMNRFQEGFMLVDPLDDPFSNPFLDPNGIRDAEHYDLLHALMGQLQDRGIISDSISDRAKAVFIFDQLNSKWAFGSDTGKSWMMSVAIAKLVDARNAGNNFSAFRTPGSRGGEDLEQIANDYEILAKAIYSTTQNHLENMGIAEDGIVRLSRAMTVGPDRIADTPEAKKLQMEIEKKRSATVDLLNLAEQKKEQNGDELEKIYANPMWQETVRAARAGEPLRPAQTLLLERYKSTQTAHDRARNEVGDLMDILRSLDSTGDDISRAFDASVGKDWAVDAIAQWNGLSSFATITQQAFGEHTFHMDVPRSRLFSLSMLGFGCISEYEVLVIGDGDDNVLYERQTS